LDITLITVLNIYFFHHAVDTNTSIPFYIITPHIKFGQAQAHTKVEATDRGGLKYNA
jgi:hypothetical protein